MLNGSFGAGKTSVAERLVRALPGSMLYDPEEVGYMLRRLTDGVRGEAEETGDFQDIVLWRTLAVEVAGHLKAQYGRHLIVPMTLANLSYYRQVRQGLAALDPALYHFCLTASAGTIAHRLTARGDAPGSWSFRQVERCVEAFRLPEFAEHIETETRSVVEVVDYILERVSLSSAR